MRLLTCAKFQGCVGIPLADAPPRFYIFKNHQCLNLTVHDTDYRVIDSLKCVHEHARRIENSSRITRAFFKINCEGKISVGWRHGWTSPGNAENEAICHGLILLGFHNYHER